MSRDKQTEIKDLSDDIFTNCQACLLEEEAEMIARYVIEEKGYRKIKTNDWLTKGISAEQLEQEKQEALDEFAKQNGYVKASDVAREVAEQFKEIAKQFLLKHDLYLVVFKNALKHAEAEIKKKYESEGADDD